VETDPIQQRTKQGYHIITHRCPRRPLSPVRAWPPRLQATTRAPRETADNVQSRRSRPNLTASTSAAGRRERSTSGRPLMHVEVLICWIAKSSAAVCRCLAVRFDFLSEKEELSGSWTLLCHCSLALDRRLSLLA
jgi:hypothetical protein